MSFKYLKNLEVDGTARCTVYSVMMPNGENPVLIGKHAGDTNKAYLNAQLKIVSRNSKRLMQGRINAAVIEEQREEDRQLFPEYVITGWENVFDDAGKEVKFSQEHCRDFISALPNYIFEEVRGFFSNPENFIEGSASAEDVIKKGNS